MLMSTLPLSLSTNDSEYKYESVDEDVDINIDTQKPTDSDNESLFTSPPLKKKRLNPDPPSDSLRNSTHKSKNTTNSNSKNDNNLDTYYLSVLENIRNSAALKEISDVTFVIKDGLNEKHYNCVSAFFAIQSKVFRDKIQQNLFNGLNDRQLMVQPNHVLLTDISCMAFEFLKDSFHTRDPILTLDTCIEIMYAAKNYEILELQKHCQHIMLINVYTTEHFLLLCQKLNEYAYEEFQPFVNDNFLSANNAFLVHNILQVVEDENERFAAVLSLKQMQQICKIKILDVNILYGVCCHWCKYRFANNIEAVVNVSSDNNGGSDDNGGDEDNEMEVEAVIDSSVDENSRKHGSDQNCEKAHMQQQSGFNIINKWQDLMSFFNTFIDYTAMDYDTLLSKVKADGIMSEKNLLLILEEKILVKKHAIGTNETKSMQVVDSKSSVFTIGSLEMSEESVMNLKIGNIIDHRDYAGLFIKSKIVAKDEEQQRIRVNFIGWPEKYDRWSSLKIDKHLFLKEGCITERDIHKQCLLNVCNGQKVLIHLPEGHVNSNAGWMSAVVGVVDVGQIQCEYYVDGKTCKWWTHTDNIEECR